MIRMRHCKLVFLSLLAAAAGTASGAAAAAPPVKPLLVFVSVRPQAEFVQAVGGDRVRVEVMVPPGRNHEIYEPTPRQMESLTRARIYFRVGLPFEEVWMSKIRANNSRLRVVDTRRGVPMIRTAASHRGHGAASAWDPHIWLDPNRVIIQARTIRDALTAADPAHRVEYARNERAFEARLTKLNRELLQILDRVPNRRFMVYHPSWSYFAQAYTLEQVPIEIEGKEPGPRSLAAEIELARRKGIKVIFVQKQASPRSAQVIARAIGGRVVSADDMPADYFAELRRLAHAIAGGS